MPTSFIYILRVSSLPLPLNDASGDIVDDERVIISFLLKLNSHHHYMFASPLQQTLKQNHCASHNCCSVRNSNANSPASGGCHLHPKGITLLSKELTFHPHFCLTKGSSKI